MQKASYERIKKLIEGLAAFGANGQGKGITRLAYTKEDFAAQKWLLEQVSALQLSVSEDAVGNTFLCRQGLNPNLPPVAMGSHLDTVIQGGAYDGMAGVVSALEALYVLQDEVLQRSVEVIVFRSEESSRFGYGTMGSKFIAGTTSVEKITSVEKKNIVPFKQALQEAGFDPARAQEAKKAPGCYKCFLELHIEQGNILDEAQEQIGIVHNIAAPTRMKIIIEGVAAHSGATPMNLRKDALVAGAKMILAIEKAAAAELAHSTVGTVGVVEVEPASVNIVPGRVVLWVDVRGVEVASIKRTLHSIAEAEQSIAESNKVTIKEELITADTPVPLSEELAHNFDEICAVKQLKYRHMNSGAGHDAMNMATLCPTSMLFIPCKEGISHNPRESAKIEDICVGVEVLAEMVKLQAQ